MSHQDYSSHRWQICYGNYQGIEKTAVEYLCSLAQAYVPYVLTAVPAKRCFIIKGLFCNLPI